MAPHIRTRSAMVLPSINTDRLSLKPLERSPLSPMSPRRPTSPLGTLSPFSPISPKSVLAYSQPPSPLLQAEDTKHIIIDQNTESNGMKFRNRNRRRSLSAGENVWENVKKSIGDRESRKQSIILEVKYITADEIRDDVCEGESKLALVPFGTSDDLILATPYLTAPDLLESRVDAKFPHVSTDNILLQQLETEIKEKTEKEKNKQNRDVIDQSIPAQFSGDNEQFLEVAKSTESSTTHLPLPVVVEITDELEEIWSKEQTVFREDSDLEQLNTNTEIEEPSSPSSTCCEAASNEEPLSPAVCQEQESHQYYRCDEQIERLLTCYKRSAEIWKESAKAWRAINARHKWRPATPCFPVDDAELAIPKEKIEESEEAVWAQICERYKLTYSEYTGFYDESIQQHRAKFTMRSPANQMENTKLTIQAQATPATEKESPSFSRAFMEAAKTGTAVRVMRLLKRMKRDYMFYNFSTSILSIGKQSYSIEQIQRVERSVVSVTYSPSAKAIPHAITLFLNSGRIVLQLPSEWDNDVWLNGIVTAISRYRSQKALSRTREQQLVEAAPFDAHLFLTYCQLPHPMLKFSKKGKQQQRQLKVSLRGTRLIWSRANGSRAQSIDLAHDIKAIVAGMFTPTFDIVRKYSSAFSQWDSDFDSKSSNEAMHKCFSIVTAKRTIDFQCPTEDDRNLWVKGLKNLISVLKERSIAISSEFVPIDETEISFDEVYVSEDVEDEKTNNTESEKPPQLPTITTSNNLQPRQGSLFEIRESHLQKLEDSTTKYVQVSWNDITTRSRSQSVSQNGNSMY